MLKPGFHPAHNGDKARPSIMAVLNVTPDSFSDGGELHRNNRLDLDLVLQRVEQMQQQGADIVDVGGESTRPGAAEISECQELERVVPVVEAITRRFDIPVSVDTSTASVMTEAGNAGAAIINDVRALRRPGALQAAAATGLPVCLMHMVGEPGSMQNNPQYGDIVTEVVQFLRSRVEACKLAGITAERIILDPGFGFGKTLEHNIELFKSLPELVNLGFPLLVGVSRKAMIGAILDKEVSARQVGSVVLATLAAQSGVSIVRVHDIEATRDALKILQAVN